MRELKAVIFDLDNTLLDRTKTFRRFAYGWTERYFGHVADAASIAERVIALDEDGYKDKRELFRELLDELPWSDKPELDALMDDYARHYVHHACLMDHALETVSQLRAAYRIGLITNGRTAIQYGKIDRLGIRELFDFILVSEEAGVKKPHAAIFEMALERVGASAGECVYIGDHPKNDIEGAGLAGLHTIWMEVNQPWREDIAVRPGHRIKRLSELAGILLAGAPNS